MNERDEELARSIDPDAWRHLHKDDENWCQQFANLIRADERESVAKFIKPTEEHRRDASWGYICGEEGVVMLDDLAASVLAGAHHD